MIENFIFREDLLSQEIDNVIDNITVDEVDSFLISNKVYAYFRSNKFYDEFFNALIKSINEAEKFTCMRYKGCIQYIYDFKNEYYFEFENKVELSLSFKESTFKNKFYNKTAIKTIRRMLKEEGYMDIPIEYLDKNGMMLTDNFNVRVDSKEGKVVIVFKIILHENKLYNALIETFKKLNVIEYGKGDVVNGNN